MAMPAVRPPSPVEWTAEMAIALPYDGKRYEVLDGELVVTPAPTWDHQTVVEELFAVLRPYVQSNAIGWLKLSPADIVLAPKRLVQPDLFVVPPTPQGVRPRGWADVKTLRLAVEVLSPSTAHVDRWRKRRIYQEHGIPEYWIVDADARLVERWRPTDERPEVLGETLTWAPRADVPAFTLDLAAFFTAVLGESA